MPLVPANYILLARRPTGVKLRSLFLLGGSEPPPLPSLPPRRLLFLPYYIGVGVDEIITPSTLRKYFWAPGTEVLGRISAFYSARQVKTPIDSSECSPEFFESFLKQLSVFMESKYDFGSSLSVFLLGLYICLFLSELGPEIMDFDPQNWQYGRTVQPRYDFGETGKCSKTVS